MSREQHIGPSKMLLLNCGKFEFAEVELDAPLHLIGPNNVGKTSLIALLQLLYIDDQRQMHFSREMPETRRYYFPDVYSYALFECLTPTGFQVVGVHGRGPVRQYEFERFAYRGRLDVADFLDDGRRIRPHEEVFAALAARDFARLEPRQLRAALTGVGDNRGVDLRLVPAQHGATYERFRKVFNNILRLSHLKQDELKALILDIYQGEFQQRRIDLAETYAQGFEKVQRDSRDVQELRQLQGEIEALLRHIERREDARRALPALWAALGRALTAARALVDREEAALREKLAADEARSTELRIQIDAISRSMRELATQLGKVTSELERIKEERARFADFVPDWAEQRQRDVRGMLEKLAYQLGQAEQTPPAQIKARLARLERDIREQQLRLKGLAHAAAPWLQKRFSDAEVEDLFRLLNPRLLDLPIGGPHVKGTLHDEARVEAGLRTVLEGRKARAWHGPGVTIALDGVHAPDLKQYVDPDVIKQQLGDLEAQQHVYGETLVAARDADALREEKRALDAELETLIRDIGDYRRFCELESHETGWREQRDALRSQEADGESALVQSHGARERVIRDIEHAKDELGRLEERRTALSEMVKDLKTPPDAWPLVSLEDLPADLEELTPRYRHVYAEERSQHEHVTDILRRIEARTYGRYVADDESDTVKELREQLESIPGKEEAVQQLWTSIAVGIKKALSNIAHDLDTLKARIQKLNQQLGRVTVSNLTSLRVLVRERADWVRHIRGVGLDEDMPLFADASAVQQSFDDLGRLLSEHPRVEIEDLFDLRFEVGTPDEKVREHRHLDAIESNGTTITIKVLVNLVLMRGLLKGAKVRIPFYLDECSSLDHDNLAAIVDAARAMGFIAVLASPDAMDAAERLYFIEEQENGRVVLDPKSALVHVAREGAPSDD